MVVPASNSCVKVVGGRVASLRDGQPRLVISITDQPLAFRKAPNTLAAL